MRHDQTIVGKGEKGNFSRKFMGMILAKPLPAKFKLLTINTSILFQMSNLFNCTRGQNFRFSQIRSICTRQNNSDSKIEIYSGNNRKHCGKRRKCWLPAFSPFSTMFSKAFFSRGVRSRDCMVKS